MQPTWGRRKAVNSPGQGTTKAGKTMQKKTKSELEVDLENATEKILSLERGNRHLQAQADRHQRSLTIANGEIKNIRAAILTGLAIKGIDQSPSHVIFGYDNQPIPQPDQNEDARLLLHLLSMTDDVPF